MDRIAGSCDFFSQNAASSDEEDWPELGRDRDDSSPRFKIPGAPERHHLRVAERRRVYALRGETEYQWSRRCQREYILQREFENGHDRSSSSETI
jgi:hypothetical protein